MSAPIVIAGASLAGASAAVRLRELGYDGELVLVGAEPHLPYERPPLSKGLLRSESTLADALVRPAEVYEDQRIELRLGTEVQSIERAESAVVLADGEQLSYDRLLLATGARPRRLPAEGADLDGVFTLRTVDDAIALRLRLTEGARLTVVGAGWIGAEVAASATQMGVHVTMIEAEQFPLERVLGSLLGSVFAGLHRDHGVHLRTGIGVSALEGRGAVSHVRLTSGERLPADVVLLGVGVEPRTELADRAGLEVGNGIEVDAMLRTSDPAILAAGDVASVEGLRVEHWDTAQRQGEAAAASLLGEGGPYDAVPYFFTDQYDLGMEYSGRAAPGDELLVRGDLAEREFIAFWLRDGRVTAGMNVNVWDVAQDIQELIRSGTRVDRRRLVDASVPLGELVSPGSLPRSSAG